MTNAVLKDLRIDGQGSGIYKAEIGAPHRFGGVLHGGFAAALAAFAALEYLRDRKSCHDEYRIAALQVEYVKSIDMRQIDLEVRELSVRKSAAKLHITLSQQGGISMITNIHALAVAAAIGPTIDTQYSLNPPAVPVNLDLLGDNRDPDWVSYEVTPSAAHGTAYLPLTHWTFCYLRAGAIQPRLYDSWCRFSEPTARITDLALPVLADSFVRMQENWCEGSNFSYNSMANRAKKGPVPELELDAQSPLYSCATQTFSLHIIESLPEEGTKWIFMRAEAKSIREGKMIVEITLFSQNGRLVALGTVTDLLLRPNDVFAPRPEVGQNDSSRL